MKIPNDTTTRLKTDIINVGDIFIFVAITEPDATVPTKRLIIRLIRNQCLSN